MKLLSAVFILIITMGASAKEPEVLIADSGQKITKEFYDSGIIRSISRHDPDGSLVGTLFHDKNGTPLYADMYDGKLLAGKLYYYANGNPKLEEHFDSAGTVRWSREFDENQNILSHKVYDENGSLIEVK